MALLTQHALRVISILEVARNVDVRRHLLDE